MKYGITLNQSLANNNNYTSSAGTVIWTRAANSNYANNITGIGRDDASGLLQKQSRSVNTNGLVYLFNGTTNGVFPAMNAANSSSFAANQSFLIVGDNGASLNFNSCAYNGRMPRMSRIWKVQKTGGMADVTVAVNTSEVSTQIKHLLVSADPSFPAASTTIYPLQTAAGKLFNNINFTTNQYFTFATDSLMVNFTVVQPGCTPPTSGAITATITGGATPQTYTWNTSPVQSGLTATNLPAGSYIFTVNNNGGCAATYNPPAIQAPPAIALAPTASPASVCAGSSSVLNGNVTGASASATSTWTPGNASGFSTTVTPATSTMYTLTVTDGACQAKDSVLVTVKPIPSTSFTATPASICLGNVNTIAYTGNAASNATYTWNFDGASVQSGSGAGPYNIVFTSAGTKNITLQITDNGCPAAAAASQTITVVQPPVASFTASPPAVCSGDTVAVAFTGSPAGGVTYTWNWGGGNVVSGTGAGPYKVQYNTSGTIGLIVNNGICRDTATVQAITVTPKPVAAFTASTLAGCAPQEISFISTSQNATSLLWQFGNGNTSTADPQAVQTFNTGIFTVTLTATQGRCMASKTATVSIVDKPVASFSATPGINAPTQLSQALFSFTNLSQNATSYRWVFGDNSSSTATNPLHRYNLPGNYPVTLYATSAAGCTDSITKLPFIVIPDSALRIPNAFSPNGDGTNDTWEIRGLPGYPTSRIDIFDRYGRSVYSSTGYTRPWDGTCRNSPVPVGTYYYVIITNEKKYSGWVMLLR